MPRTRRLSDSELIEKTSEDPKVSAALEDAIAAILHYGADAVNMNHLKSVIEYRLAVWAEHEVEEEGLDGECA